ncbi:MAG: ABC transporter ATP-binding protein [Bacteroidota bacterium]
MTPCSVTLVRVSKEFNRRPIFTDIDMSLSAPASIALTGRNGSGKSTLAKIVAGLLSPTQGVVHYACDGKPMDLESMRTQLGFVSPYLNLYDEFSALENLMFLSRIRGDKGVKTTDMETMLEGVGLAERMHDRVGTFSSGMKQRLKYAFALLHKPSILILDEPTSNLDTEGSAFVHEIVVNQRKSGILVVATNDAHEASWCERRIRLGQ